MKTLGGYALFVLAVCVAVALFLDKQEARGRAVRAEQQASVWQAKYAEEALKSEQAAETVRVNVTRVQVARDTVLARITDTAYIREYIHRVDTLMVACLICAARLDSLRFTSDSMRRSLEFQVEASKPNWIEERWWLAGVGGMVLGAWLRGSGR